MSQIVVTDADNEASSKPPKFIGDLSSIKKLKLPAAIKRKPKKMLVLAAILLGVLGTVYFGYKFNQARAEVRRLSNAKQNEADETNRVKTAVGRLVYIPTDETPTLATVTDASKLKSQSFFKDAQNGDKVLVFNGAKKAILYRPSTDKVIEIAPVSFGNDPAKK